MSKARTHLSAEQRAERIARRARLIELGERRQALQAEQAQVTAELRDAVRNAAAVGWGVTNLAEFAGMTRRAIYDILGR
jgi:hypothetical protein